MVLDNTFRSGKTKAGSSLFGGKIDLKYFVNNVFWNTCAGICYIYVYVFFIQGSTGHEFPAIFHCLFGIDNDIQNCLFYKITIYTTQREIGIIAFLDQYFFLLDFWG